MIIVSDTSPIINLAAIDHLHLLPDIFTEIIIPQAVYNEITVSGAGEPGAEANFFIDRNLYLHIKNTANE